MAKRGRPTEYTPEIAEEVLRRLGDGESLRTICADEHIPSKGAVLGWVVDDREGFADRYRRARAVQAEGLTDELFDIADNDQGDVNRDRLKVDTRKWYIAKVLPKFADRLETSSYDFDPADFSREGLKRVAAGESPQHVLATGGGKGE